MSEEKMQFAPGDEVKIKITGGVGVVDYAGHDRFRSAPQYLVEFATSTGGINSRWFDESELEAKFQPEAEEETE